MEAFRAAAGKITNLTDKRNKIRDEKAGAGGDGAAGASTAKGKAHAIAAFGVGIRAPRRPSHEERRDGRSSAEAAEDRPRPKGHGRRHKLARAGCARAPRRSRPKQKERGGDALAAKLRDLLTFGDRVAGHRRRGEHVVPGDLAII